MVSLDVLMEPKGAIKILEFLLNLIAWSVLASSSPAWESRGNINKDNYEGSVQYLMAMLIIGWIMSMALVGVYAIADDAWTANTQAKFGTFDFAGTALYSLLLFLASAIWVGIGDNIDIVVFDSIFSSNFPDNEKNRAVAGFSFMAWFIWTVNLWFLYKDTNMHKGKASSGGNAAPSGV
eukprot:Clim_evm28s147 gene=Clim_evmTU28s147